MGNSEKTLKKIIVLSLIFLSTLAYSFDVRHAVSIDTLPTVRFLMRAGLGVGLSYELWIANMLGIDLTLSYGQANSVELGILKVITPRLSGKYYFDFSPPFFNYIALIFDDDIAGNSADQYEHVFGVGAGIGSKIIFNGTQGFFMEPHFAFMVKFSAVAPTATEFEIGARFGWVF
jgi:hypothetical protein